MAETDIYLLPSISEGLNNSVLEAMATGLPVVSTDVDGMPEAVTGGRTGLLVPPCHPGAMADALSELASDGRTREELGRAARERAVAQFDLQPQIQRFVDRYAELLGGRP